MSPTTDDTLQAKGKRVVEAGFEAGKLKLKRSITVKTRDMTRVTEGQITH